MPDYRRYYIPNSIIFITAVTKDRKPYLKLEDDLAILFNTLTLEHHIHPFHLLAYVILPDHFHWLMTAGNTTGNFSIVLKSIKRNYTLNYKKENNISTELNIWQRGFWDHVIRNDKDLQNHFDYIHWNPVKHGYVNSPEIWKYSTYSFWYERDYYASGWGETGIPSNIINMNYE